MKFDIVLPTVLFLITAIVLFLYSKVESKIKALLEERELRIRDIIVLVTIMAITVSIGVITPAFAIMAIFLCFFSLALFVATCLVMPKWYLALITPTVFLAGYYFFRDYPLLQEPINPFLILYIDFFAAIFVVFISIYLGSLFTWKTTGLFVGLIVIVDVFQVFVTGHMQETGRKMLDLKLPVMMLLPTFPYKSIYGLGLGDFFFSSLLSIQTSKIYGRKIGLASAVSMAVVFAIFEAAQIHFNIKAMPATLFIICGWLIAMAITFLYKRKCAPCKKAV